MSKSTPAGFTPVETPRAFEQVCVQIRALVSSGALKKGDKLPPERELAEHLRVSRGVLREALRTLEIAGLVELKKGGAGGAFIVAGQYRMLTQTFKDMVHMGSVTLSDLTEARQRFMVTAVELACERATEEDFAAIEANIQRTEACLQSGDALGREAAAVEFYHLLALASKNQVIVVTVDSMTLLLRQFYRPTTIRPPLQLLQSRKRMI
ncbi:MAG: FadR/GntR family transcriptional regulator, partial [Janthinobacterium lividum]